MTAKLTGEFYVGQRVHMKTGSTECYVKVLELFTDHNGHPRLRVEEIGGTRRQFSPVVWIVTPADEI